jgi:hypothetical protein
MRSIKTASKMHGEADGERQFSAADVMNRSGKLLARLVDLFESAEAVDEEVSHINGSAPSGEHRRLLGVELAARGLESFGTADPPIAKGVQLPDWAHSARMAWPPPGTFDPASFAPVAFDRRLSAEWGLVQEEGRAMRE